MKDETIVYRENYPWRVLILPIGVGSIYGFRRQFEICFSALGRQISKIAYAGTAKYDV